MSGQSMIDPTLSTGYEPNSAAAEQPISNTATGPDEALQPDDVLSDYQLAVERAQTWTSLARFGFNAMLASSTYKNKLRLKNDKLDRILFFLTVPDAKSREKDRADAQIKHQAQQWIYHAGRLYSKESRLQRPRRHVAAAESFDILTGEHLRSGHHGRDKMLKVLEAKYIGYTKDELMYVLDHCLVCASKHIRGAAARRRDNKMSAEPALLDGERAMEMTSTIVNHPDFQFHS